MSVVEAFDTYMCDALGARPCESLIETGTMCWYCWSLRLREDSDRESDVKLRISHPELFKEKVVKPLPVHDHPLSLRFVGHRVYFVTLTEKCLGEGCEHDPRPLLKLVDRLIKSKCGCVSDWVYCLELTEQGHPHIHALMNCSGPGKFERSKWKKMVDGRSDWQVPRNVSDVLKYIFKKDSKPSIEYLTKYGASSISQKEEGR